MRETAQSAIALFFAVLMVTSVFGVYVDLTGDTSVSPIGTAKAQLSHDAVYSGGGDNTIRAGYSANGSQIWGQPTGATPYGSAVSPDGSTVYYSLADGSIKSVNEGDGTEQWSATPHTNEVRGITAGPNGDYIYTVSYDNTVKKLHAGNGSEVWSYTGLSDNGMNIDISKDGSTIYAGAADNVVHAIYPNGTQKWTYTGHSGTVTRIETRRDSNVVYTGSSDNTVKAIYANGSEKWTSTAPGTSVYGLAAAPDDKDVYAAAGSTVYKLNAGDGSTEWSSSVPAANVRALSASKDAGSVYVGEYDGIIRELDAADGSELWNVSAHGTGNYVQDLSSGAKYHDSLTNTVSGTVTDSDGKAIDGATVTVEETGDSTTTDSNGQYSFNLDDGTYTITASETGYNDNSETVTVSGSDVTGVDITLYGDFVSGTVLDPNGDPVDGATIETNQSARSTTSDANGNYEIELLHGTHTLTANKSGYEDGINEVSLSGANVSDLNITLGGNTISGTVTDQNGNPIANATVEIWLFNDANTTTDPGETVEEAHVEKVEKLSRSVPKPDGSGDSLYEPDLDPINAEKFTDGDACKQVLVHEEGAYTEEGTAIGNNTVQVAGGDLRRPIRELDPGADYAFSIWNRCKNPWPEDGIDEKINPGVTTSGTIVIEQVGPGNSSIDRLKIDTQEMVKTGWPVTTKKHEYAPIALPAGYYKLVPESGGVPDVIRVGSPERIPRTIEPDTTDVDGNTAAIAKEVKSEIDNGALKRVVVETDASGQFSYAAQKGYSTATITAFDGRGLTDGITDPTMQDLRTQVQAQEYNGSILLSSSPTTVHPPKSGIEITMMELDRPTLGNLQGYLDNLKWLEGIINEESFRELAALWSEPTVDVGTDELEGRAAELQALIEQNQALLEQYRDAVDQNKNLTRTVEELSPKLEEGTLSREEVEELAGEQQTIIKEIQPEITVEQPDPPAYEVPEDDQEPTLLDLELPIRTPWSTDSTELSRDGVLVMVHWQNGTSSEMGDQYWSIENRPGAASGSGSAVVVDDYPIPADVAVANIELVVANEDGVGRDQVQVENPAVEGTPPELASIDVSTMRPGPSERVSIGVTPTATSTYDSLAGATVTAPDGTKLATSITGDTLEFTTSGAGTHVVQLNVSDGSRYYVETVRLKAGEEPIDYPASVRVHSGILGKKVIASDGVETARVSLERGGSAARITAEVDRENVPGEIHVHTRELTGIQQDVSVAVVAASDGSRVSKSPVIKLHLNKISENALVRKDGEPITAEGNRHGKLDDQGDATLITAVATDGTADISINNDPDLGDRISFWIDKRLAGFSALFLSPTIAVERAVADAAASITALFDAVAAPGVRA